MLEVIFIILAVSFVIALGVVLYNCALILYDRHK
jgi:hypothetical protein